MNSSTIYLDQKALANNIDYIRSLKGGETLLSSVLKANAYGHGIPQMVMALQKLKVGHFSVFSSFEAREVFREATGDFTIMIMGDIARGDEDWVIKNEVDFFVFNFYRLERMLAKAKKFNKKINIHVEVETGMNRTGFNKSQWKQLVEYLKKNSGSIHIKGICTHFAGAESIANYKRIHDQRKTFKKALGFFKDNGISPERIHCSCSAAMLSFPQANYDMVRIGILQYGLWPSRETFISHMTKKKLEDDPLEPVLSWKSYIMDTKKVKKGVHIGYGTTYLAETDMVIAAVPVGYGYGYDRDLSNQGRVIVGNNRLSVIGIVNMNMLLIDITQIAGETSIGDEVVLIGKHNDLEITVNSFENLTSKLNYEVLARLDKDIPRKLI